MKTENDDDLTGNFQVGRVNRDLEARRFSKRNQALILGLPLLLESIDMIFRQIEVPSDPSKIELNIYMMGRLCCRLFESIFLLALAGHGFSATRILRSLFEKTVDLLYLKENPELLIDFRQFFLLELERNGFSDIAEEADKDYRNIIKRFKFERNGRYWPRWTKIDLISVAKKVGMEEEIILQVYRFPNSYVHTSAGEVLQSLERSNDGSLLPVTEAAPMERHLSDTAMQHSIHLLKIILDLEIIYFGLVTPPQFANFFKSFDFNFQGSLPDA